MSDAIPDNVSLKATTRASGSTDKQVGTVTLQLGPDARVVVEVRRPTKADAMSAAAKLADTITKAARGDSTAIAIAKSIIPPQVTGALKLAGGIARLVKSGKLRSIWHRLPSSLRSRASSLAKDLTS